MEISSGSLGHGLPLAAGVALGLKARGLTDSRVFVLVGDAELDEGSNHEAIAFARAARLDALHVVVVDNSSSTYGWPGGVEARFAVEGWSVRRVSGRDHDALETALTAPHPGRPHLVAAVVEPKYAASPAHVLSRNGALGDGHGDHAGTVRGGNERPAGQDPRLAVVLADISADAFRPAAARFPDRVINVGIREQLLISVAGGLSLAGMRPIAHTFAASWSSGLSSRSSWT